ncbi:transcription termination factor Rho [Leucobacter tenebrionis]|uniref:transcription termination factor Rho n=1 Tax=Leucobacter tenebrionis TaxID=2873270 RepID=UPI001CA631E6|nr:transcription termination factor Rho [Leucobacter tenebrionis]QZY51579.1 transcription termination factor Rho [Leucobacter tenebrionis]
MESNVEETNSAPAAEETAPVRRRASRRVSTAAGTVSEAAPAETQAAGAAAPAEAAAAPAEAAAAPAEAGAPAEAAPAAEAAAEAPKKRASRSRKKAAEEAPAEAPAADASAEPAAAKTPAESASDAADPGEVPAEAPKKRASRSRKKAAEEAPAEAAAEVPATDAPVAAEAPAGESDTSAAENAETAAAPAKRGRSRRAQAESKPQAETEATEDQPAEKSAEQASGGKAKAKGRGKQSQNEAPQNESAEEPAKDEAAKADAAKSDAAKSDAEGEGNGRGRGRRTRGQKNENGEAADAAEQNDDSKGRGQSQGGDKNGQGKGENASRSTRTRQRDRKRRGQNDDLEPEITEDDVLLPVAGILDVLDNYAFVRTSGYLPGTSDVYVSLGQVKKYGLRRGDAVVGAIRQPREGEGGGRQKYNAIVKVDTVNGRTVDENEKRVDIADLTPVFPQERLSLETTPDRLLGRAIDIAAPIGLGQRGLLVLPASAHGVGVLSELAQAISANRPDAHLMVVLANAQPEEITHLQRTISGEVVAASFDRPAEDQATVAELAIDRAKRLVELGHDVVVLVDSLNRFARAYAQAQHASARPAFDEIDEFALGQIKRLLAAARNVENGGSLTVLATAQTKTGVDADKLLLREVRAVANSEVRFEKSLPGTVPAVDLEASLTRNAEAMLGAAEAAALSALRERIASDDDAVDEIAARLRATASNAALLAEVQRSRA